MSPGGVLVAFLAFAAAETAWEAWLILLNMRHVSRRASEVPRFFRELWSRRRSDPPDETYARSVRYTLARSRLALAAHLFSASLVVAVVASGALGWLDTALAGAIGSLPLRGVAFVCAVGLILQIAGLPFGLWGQFVIEQRFGFNTTKLGLWLVDRLKGLAVSAVLLVPLLVGLFWLMGRAGAGWWVWASGMVMAFQALLTVLFPAVISPLFNRFVPLEEGSLKSRVLELAERLGFRVRGIVVMDASRRSSHSNAYFTGIGAAKRIVFYDTLLTRAVEDQVLAVLAHEIGHAKLGHVRKQLLISAAATVAGLWVLSLLLGWEAFFRGLGMGGPSAYGAVVLVALCAGPFTFFLQPLVSLISRRFEYSADRFAWRAMGSSAPLVGALLDLHTENLSNLAPHPLYSFYHYSHPTLAERVRALEALDETGAPKASLTARSGLP